MNGVEIAVQIVGTDHSNHWDSSYKGKEVGEFSWHVQGNTQEANEAEIESEKIAKMMFRRRNRSIGHHRDFGFYCE